MLAEKRLLTLLSSELLVAVSSAVMGSANKAPKLVLYSRHQSHRFVLKLAFMEPAREEPNYFQVSCHCEVTQRRLKAITCYERACF